MPYLGTSDSKQKWVIKVLAGQIIFTIAVAIKGLAAAIYWFNTASEIVVSRQV